jgi:SAM-dependent methyltransferase
MLAVARSLKTNPPGIKWYETALEAMPLEDASFDVVLCQCGIQFTSDKLRALTEARRVLRPGGRLLWNVPGPLPELFGDFAEALGQHISPKLAGFVNAVFALHDAEQLRALMSEAGFANIRIDAAQKRLRLPKPADFMWQYIHSTPMAELVGRASQEQHQALTADLQRRWDRFVVDGGLNLDVTVTTVQGEKPAAPAAG